MKSMMMIGCALAVASAFAGTVYEAKFAAGMNGFELKGVGGPRDGNAYEVRDFLGEKNALVLTKNLKSPSKGTNFQVIGEKFAVTPGTRLAVITRTHDTFGNAKTMKDLRFAHGYFGNYITGIDWFDKDGNKSKNPWGFGFESAPDGKWAWTIAATEVPEDAVWGRLSIGFDSPNFDTNDVFAVSVAKVVVSERGDSAKKVTLRDDGMTLVGGKPFFPIGVYAVHKCPQNNNDYDKAISDLKSIGFNLLHHTRPTGDNDEFLAACEKYGMMVFAQPVAGIVDHTSDNFVTDPVMEKQLRHNCILSWYLADDTASHVGPEVVALRHRICKAFDPDRLTLQADAVMMGGANCRYDRFVHSTDVFLPEIYPCYHEKPNGGEVAEVVWNMEACLRSVREAGGPVKSIWPIIQHFDGWGWKRFPTAAELRAMMWEGIIHGGNGVVIYVYHSASGKGRGIVEPEHWAEIAPITREMSELSDRLVKRDAAEQPKIEVLEGPKKDYYGFRSVSARLKEDGLLLMANSTTNSVKARVCGPETCGIYDFAPYEVKIIR